MASRSACLAAVRAARLACASASMRLLCPGGSVSCHLGCAAACSIACTHARSGSSRAVLKRGSPAQGHAPAALRAPQRPQPAARAPGPVEPSRSAPPEAALRGPSDAGVGGPPQGRGQAPQQERPLLLGPQRRPLPLQRLVLLPGAPAAAAAADALLGESLLTAEAFAEGPPSPWPQPRAPSCQRPHSPQPRTCGAGVWRGWGADTLA